MIYHSNLIFRSSNTDVDAQLSAHHLEGTQRSGEDCDDPAIPRAAGISNTRQRGKRRQLRKVVRAAERR